MIDIFKHALNKNAWLFLAAAWLYTLSFIFTNYFSYSSSATKVAKTVSDYIKGEERSFKNILRDSTSVAAIISDSPSKTKEDLITDAQGFFAYHVNDIGDAIEIFWNTNKMAIASADLYKKDGSYVVQYQNGTFEYIKKTITQNNTTYFLCSLIPVQWQYFTHNQYLRSSFAVHEEIGNAYQIADFGVGAPVKNSQNKIIFTITERPEFKSDTPGVFSILLRLTALFFLLSFISNMAAEIVRRKNFISGFIFLVACFLILRLIIYFIPFPFNYRTLTLFSPSVYYGEFINRSLGDLLFNSILLLWVVIFFRRFYRTGNNFSSGNIKKILQVSKYAVFILIPFFTFCIADISSSLVTNSTISFNAADFFSLSVYSFTGFAIICILLYVWIYVTGVMLTIALSLSLPLYWRLVLFLSSSFLFASIKIFQVQPEILLVVSAFLIVILLFIEFRNNPSVTSLVSSTFFIVWALILTASVSALIIYQNNNSEKKDRIQIAENMQQETDSAGIFLLKMELSNFSDDFLKENFFRLTQPAENKFLKDSLLNQTLAAYNNKYITRVYFFDENNHPLHNNDSTNFDVINSILENKGTKTSLDNLFYYNNADGNYNYIYKKPVYDSSSFLGTLFILIQPRSFKNDVLVPELFKQVNDVTSQLDRGYTFGIYDNLKLVSAFTGFNFADSVTQSQLPTTKYYYKDSLGFSQLWYKAGNNKLIIVAKRNSGLFNFITLFAYLFVLFIILAFIVHESKRMLQEPAEKFTFRNFFRFNIRTQVQTTIIGVSILSFLVIGIATISFFILRFQKSTTAELLNTSLIISNEIKPILSYSTIPQSGNIIDSEYEDDFQKRVSEIASVHNADINFYSRAGNLIVSSQPFIYSKQILSTKIDPVAFNEMHYRHSTRFTHDESIGSYTYQSVYIPLKNDDDETIAYLNIPSLSSELELKEEISDFLVTLIILNALIFIFAGAIAVALTGRITSSLELIGNKMKQIKIGAANEEITWKRNDEIGMLVDEYNKMVHQLEESASVLARSEREDAWREMARQVAHEIKNPLTPMKLSIQYLQRSIENNSPNTLDLSKKLATTLIEQIDQLSKIASDFSQFANIESVHPERFNLNEIIQSLVNLFNADSSVKVNWHFDDEDYFINSDKIQINRLFTNLIKNAIEASSTEKEAIRVTISQYVQHENVIISIHDNGHGIDEELQLKIFDPNFTTKSSGTGLGLAICKAIVEKANGKIWFITAPGEGTIFYVALPLAE